MKLLNLSILLLSIIILSGCAGVRYNDTVRAQDISSSNKRRVTTKVLAKAGEWRNSGVIVLEGHSYSIKAQGRWRVSGLCRWTNADGDGAHCFQLSHIEGWPGGALIGKIGENGLEFGIGNDYELTPNYDGILYLRINDCEGCFFDNEGHQTVITSYIDEKSTTDIIEQLQKINRTLMKNRD